MAIGYTDPRMPAAGTPLRAGWGASVSRSVRQVIPLQVPGMLISRKTYGTTMRPMVEAQASAWDTAGTELRPFTVRWLAHDDDGTQGEWQIYLPTGCATLTQTTAEDGALTLPYIPVNAKAKDRDGNDIPKWYKIPDPVNGKDDDMTTMDGKIAHSWAVHVLLEPWARMKVTACPSSEPSTKTYKWDEVVATIGVVEYSGGTEPTERLAESTKANSGDPTIEREWDATGDFAIRYEFQNGSQQPSATPKAYITNQHRFLGRLDKTLAGDTEITSWTGTVSVWVKILHDSTTFQMSVERNLTGSAAESDDDKTVYKIYTLKNLVPTTDTRAGFPATVFYTSPASQEEPNGSGPTGNSGE